MAPYFLMVRTFGQKQSDVERNLYNSCACTSTNPKTHVHAFYKSLQVKAATIASPPTCFERRASESKQAATSNEQTSKRANVQRATNDGRQATNNDRARVPCNEQQLASHKQTSNEQPRANTHQRATTHEQRADEQTRKHATSNGRWATSNERHSGASPVQ